MPADRNSSRSSGTSRGRSNSGSSRGGSSRPSSRGGSNSGRSSSGRPSSGRPGAAKKSSCVDCSTALTAGEREFLVYALVFCCVVIVVTMIYMWFNRNK